MDFFTILIRILFKVYNYASKINDTINRHYISNITKMTARYLLSK